MSVCVSVCLPASISTKPHARSLPNFLCMLHMAMARSSFGVVTKSQGEGAAVLGFCSPLTMHFNLLAADNVMQQKASFQLQPGVMGVHVLRYESLLHEMIEPRMKGKATRGRQRMHRLSDLMKNRSYMEVK